VVDHLSISADARRSGGGSQPGIGNDGVQSMVGTAMLTQMQSAELEKWESNTVKAHLSIFPYGAGASVTRFKCGNITRRNISSWLSEKGREEQHGQHRTFRWAKAAAIASIIGLLIGIAGLVLRQWQQWNARDPTGDRPGLAAGTSAVGLTVLNVQWCASEPTRFILPGLSRPQPALSADRLARFCSEAAPTRLTVG